jgi:hypothetical protein
VRILPPVRGERFTGARERSRRAPRPALGSLYIFTSSWSACPGPSWEAPFLSACSGDHTQRTQNAMRDTTRHTNDKTATLPTPDQPSKQSRISVHAYHRHPCAPREHQRARVSQVSLRASRASGYITAVEPAELRVAAGKDPVRASAKIKKNSPRVAHVLLTRLRRRVAPCAQAP